MRSVMFGVVDILFSCLPPLKYVYKLIVEQINNNETELKRMNDGLLKGCNMCRP